MRRECLDSVNKGQARRLANRSSKWPQLACLSYVKREHAHQGAMETLMSTQVNLPELCEFCSKIHRKYIPIQIPTVTTARVSACTSKSTNETLKNTPSFVHGYILDTDPI